jgi:phosphatidate phosphatase PAH1
MQKILAVLTVAGLAACAETPVGELAELDGGAEQKCRATKNFVATDIDETLTLSNEEWEMQLDDPAYDQQMRPDANTLMQEYARKGYSIVYITARWSGFDLSDGRSSTEVTTDWLEDHDFPVRDSLVYLAPTEDPLGMAVADFKAGVIDDLTARGGVFAYGYGNAETDVEAFLDAGGDPADVFHVGDDDGHLGVVPLPDDEAYTAHLADHLATVPDVSRCR